MTENNSLISSDNDLVYVPEEDINISFEVTADKPLNACFQCHSFRNSCYGPCLPVMDVKRTCEFLQLARIDLGHTYQYVAEQTGLSLTTVRRTLTGKISDPGFYTISELAKLLVGDPHGKFPCAFPNVDSNDTQKLTEALIQLDRALADKSDYRTALDNIHTSYRIEMQQIRDEAQRKIDFLLSEIKVARENADYWRAESERKGKLIDKHLEKIVSN